MSKKTRSRLYRVFRFAMLGVWLFVVGFPIYWIVMTSFKPDYEWISWPPVYWTLSPTLDSYRTVWGATVQRTAAQITLTLQTPHESLGNSLLISLVSTTISVAFGTLLAYGVSRQGILSEVRMFNLLMFRMIPPIVVAVPLTLYYSAIYLLDTATGVILVYVITTLPYSVWMTKSFVDEVPLEVEQAAAILGANRWRTFWEITLPLIRSGVVATFMFILILTWSEYLMALILTKTNMVTLPIQFTKYEGTTEGRIYGSQAALAVGTSFPLIIIGIFIRKHLVRGFSFGMVKR